MPSAELHPGGLARRHSRLVDCLATRRWTFESQSQSCLKALGIDNILGFDWLASPSTEAMIRALEVLYALGVLDEDAKLTSPIGFQVSRFLCVYYELLNIRIVAMSGRRDLDGKRSPS
ncbi:hypothetical protein Scep_028290 [Stephania cephalantha]|uniref:Helicase associated domain-containing protein n=1 Tax=Stephania cephalantha TaxID=152367 RepID=A0AAP0EDI6_9MAGN